MIQIEIFTFNPFQENTYILWDETQECVIIDPGCHVYEERKALTDFISEKELKISEMTPLLHPQEFIPNQFTICLRCEYEDEIWSLLRWFIISSF